MVLESKNIYLDKALVERGRVRINKREGGNLDALIHREKYRVVRGLEGNKALKK
jgi:hypothetical protein